MRYIGLDVHKDNITACVLTSTGKPKFEKDFLKESGNWILDELLDFGDKEGFCVMMESGTYAYAPFRFLSDKGVEVHVVHAKALKVITDSDKKTDRKDALTIAKMLRLWKKGDIDLQMAYMPTREQCELKDICRYREEISKKIGDETRRIKSHMSRNCEYLPEEFDNFQTEKARQFVKSIYPKDRTLMRRMDCLIELFNERDLIKEDVESRLPCSREVELLCGIPGHRETDRRADNVHDRGREQIRECGEALRILRHGTEGQGFRREGASRSHDQERRQDDAYDHGTRDGITREELQLLADPVLQKEA